MKRAPGHARLARFHPTKAEPEHTVGLPADHPAVVQGRTLFRNRISPTEGSMRFLVSGANNAKIGKAVEKGPWGGMPIFTLTLEERKTCPRSCAMWRDCYGNAMQWSPRWDHTDPAFLPTLQAEIITLGRANPKGFVVRLHVLGDFFSVRYVYFWAEMLAVVPSLRVYGYTARTVLDADPESARIAQALAVLTDGMWSRFAVRTSGGDPDVADALAIVVDTPEEAKERDAILCPSQTSATETCGTCGLCWSESARGRTIAFLRHGMKRTSGPRQPKAAPQPEPKSEPDGQPKLADWHSRRAPGAVAAHHADEEARLLAAIGRLAGEAREVCASLRVLAESSGIPHGSVLFVVRRLAEAGRLEVIKSDRGQGSQKPNAYRLPGASVPTPPQRPAEPQPAAPAAFDGPTARDRLYAALLARCDAEGHVESIPSIIGPLAGVPTGTWAFAMDQLKRDGRVSVVRTGRGGVPSLLKVSRPPLEKPARAPLAQEPILPVEPLKPARSRYVGDLPPEPAPAPPPVAAEPDAEPLDAPVAGARPNSILALGYRACRWPTNTPPPGRGDLTTFCCAQTDEGETYCRKHTAAATAGPGREWTPEQRAAAAARARSRAALKGAQGAAA